MKRFIFGVIITSSLVFANTVLDDVQELQGDEKLACEAILCLSTGQRPSECNPSINHYFSIKAKKMSDTIKKRRDFLKLCPDGGAETEDLVYKDLIEDVLPGSDPRQCTAEYLNQQIEIQENYSNNGYNSYSNSYMSYRVNPNIPRECQALYNHSYVDIQQPKYICDKTFYSELEWKLNSTLEAISYKEYRNLPNDSKYTIYDDYSTNYYKLVPFNKTCFVEVE